MELYRYTKSKVTLTGDLAPLKQIKDQINELLVPFAGEYPDEIITDDDINTVAIKIYDELTQEPPQEAPKPSRARGTGESMLQIARLSKGLSQSQLARKSKVSINTIQDYEKYFGKINRGHAEIVIRLAGALEVHPAEILDKIKEGD